MKNKYNNLAIIILNYKNYEMTIECVDKLLSKKFACNIVIVDNNSPNKSVENLVNKYQNNYFVDIIENNENSGYASGNNIGIKYAKNNYNCKYVCIMNPDIIIEDDNIFNDLLNKLEKHKLQGISALQITNNHFDYSTLGWKIPSYKDILILNSNIISKLKSPIRYKSINIINSEDALAEIGVMPGCFFIMDLSAFERIGFFDEGTFLYYEENILASKAKELNYKFGISLNNFYIHNHKSKDESLLSLKNKYNDRRILLNSQKYYVNNTLKLNKIIYKMILNLSQNYNIYIELPILHIIKKLGE